MRSYLQIVEGRRVPGRKHPQQRLIATIARIDSMDEKKRKSLRRLAERFI